MNHLACRQNYLKGKDQQCLNEIFTPKADSGADESDSKKKKKDKKKKKSTKNKKGDSGGKTVVPEVDESTDSKSGKDEL